jgi:hypothetical protein
MTLVAARPQRSLENSSEVALTPIRDNRLQSELKRLAIKMGQETPAVMPSATNVNNLTYAFTLPLYLYIDWKNSGDQAKAFFNFCSSRSGNKSGK